MTTGLAGPKKEAPPGEIERAVPRVPVSPWVLMAVTCILLGVSGGVRFWRELKFRTLADESTACPFHLKDLPRSMGGWTSLDDLDSQLDPQIARIAGSSEHIIRTYKNDTTGEVITAFVLYGLAQSVFGHTPEACYPTAGFQPSKEGGNHQFSIPGSTVPVQYRKVFFVQKSGGIVQSDEKEVCYTFLHNGTWVPDVASRWKSFRYHPAIFKIQLERRATTFTMDNSPSESLLKLFVEEIESRLSQSKPRGAAVATL